MAHLSIGGRRQQSTDDNLHLVVAVVCCLVDVQHLLGASGLVRLVEDAQYLVQTVVNLTVQEGYLHDDAVVGQTVDKRVGQSFGHLPVVIVVRVAAHVEHRFLDVANLMAQQVDGHHGDGIALPAVGYHVGRIGILGTQILAEAQGLGLDPRFLQLYEHQVLRAVGLANRRAEVDAEDGESVAPDVGVLVTSGFDVHYVLLQEGRKERSGYAFVLHQILKHAVVDGICNCQHIRMIFVS